MTDLMGRAVVPVLLLTWASAAAAQGLTPRPARPEDVASVDAIVRAFYEVISHEAGQRIDWERDSTLYRADLRFRIVSGTPAAPRLQVIDHATYARSFSDVAEPFFEHEIHRVTQRFGAMAHVFSTYEWRRSRGGPPAGRGINALELYFDGRRWWISSAMWLAETPENPIPAAYLPR